MLKQKREERLKLLCVHDLPHHHFLCLRFQPIHVRHPEKLCALFVRRGVLSNRVVIVRSSHAQTVFWTSCKCGQSEPFRSIRLYSTDRWVLR